MDEQESFDREFLIIWLCWAWTERVRPLMEETHRAFVAAGLLAPIDGRDAEQ